MRTSRPLSRLRWLAGLSVVALLAVGCTKSNEGQSGAPTPETPSGHPAMKGETTVPPTAPPTVANPATRGLPPGHPPIPPGMAAGAEGKTLPPATTAVAEGQALPPGHPPLPSGMTPSGTTPPGMTAGAEGKSMPPMGMPKPPAGDLASRLAKFGVKLDVPDAWKEGASTSSMRLATFRLPKAEGDKEDGEVSVIPALGSEDANITRWQGQFQEKPEAKTSTREVSGIRITTTEITGTFMGAGDVKPGTTLQAAIIRIPGIDQLLFIKGWGPTATMEKYKPSFAKLVDSVAASK